MNLSVKKIFLMGILLLSSAGRGFGQANLVDSILPPDHLLENLPWFNDDGKVESKGLFDFEDVRGAGQKDLILIYRQSVPVNEMDKPHNQTLIVCFFNPAEKKYVKSFEDEGGTIQWVKLVSDPAEKSPFLILQRDDLNGNQVLKGFAFLNGSLKPVLETSAPQMFTKFSTGSRGVEILCSSKALPINKDTAERVFDWDKAKTQFAEVKTLAAAVVASAETPGGPTGTASIASKTSHPSKDGWWDDPFEPQAAFVKLKTQLVPESIQKGQMAQLGQKAKAFFTVAQKKGTKAPEIASMRSGYYAAVASAILDKGDSKNAAYYLKLALGLQSDNPDALALKARMK